MPELFNNDSYEQWVAEGSVNTTERALQKVRKLLNEYQQPPLDEGLNDALRDYMARREREIPAMDALNQVD